MALDQDEIIKKKSSNIKSNHINVLIKEQCFGCTACENSCVLSCIEMKPDKEGFLYPVVNEDKCINCGKCIDVCPYINVSHFEMKKIYAAINRKDDVRLQSSSGGVFYEVAKQIIKEGGIVYGCAWDDRMIAKHIRIDNVGDIRKLQGSKYVQSQLDDIYQQVKIDLLRNTIVLFSGTPCQIAGLKKFLISDYHNLISVDLLCHGVPSPKLFSDYVSKRENEAQSKIVNINQRDKKNGWHRLHSSIELENGQIKYVYSGYDEYMSMFLDNLSLRPSCFKCKFASNLRQGDITLGDFWGVGKFSFSLDDDKGTSLVSINSEKGRKLWESISSFFVYTETSLELAKSGNKVLIKPSSRNENRDYFYQTYIQEGFELALNKYVNIPSKTRQRFYNLRRIILDFLRMMLRIKY